MFRNPIERIHLFVASATIGLSCAFLAKDLSLAVALGSVLGGVNLALLHRSSAKLFSGELKGATGWSAIFLLRFLLFALAIGVSLGSGIDPVGLIIGFSTILPAVVVATWKTRPAVTAAQAELVREGSSS